MSYIGWLPSFIQSSDSQNYFFRPRLDTIPSKIHLNVAWSKQSHLGWNWYWGWQGCSGDGLTLLGCCCHSWCCHRRHLCLPPHWSCIGHCRPSLLFAPIIPIHSPLVFVDCYVERMTRLLMLMMSLSSLRLLSCCCTCCSQRWRNKAVRGVNHRHHRRQPPPSSRRLAGKPTPLRRLACTPAPPRTMAGWPAPVVRGRHCCSHSALLPVVIASSCNRPSSLVTISIVSLSVHPSHLLIDVSIHPWAK
jgi:hypothetical protein